MLDVTAIDALIGGLATAFFGALVAGGAYLLRQQIILRERLETLRSELRALHALDRMLRAGRQDRQRLKSNRIKSGRDADDA